MYVHISSLSPVIILLAMYIVYVDTSHRNLAWRTKLQWIGSVGLVSFCGFYGSYMFQAQIARVYVFVSGKPMNALTADELLTSIFAMGVTISALAVFVYVIGSRGNQFTLQLSP